MAIATNMATHMKTTVEIADPILEEAKAIAAREGTTMRALVETGLRYVVAERQARYSVFKLRDAAFDGEGIQPDLRDASWDQIRDLAYGHDA